MRKRRQETVNIFWTSRIASGLIEAACQVRAYDLQRTTVMDLDQEKAAITIKLERCRRLSEDYQTAPPPSTFKKWKTNCVNNCMH